MAQKKSFVAIALGVFFFGLVASSILGIVFYDERAGDDSEEKTRNLPIDQKGLFQNYLKLKEFMSPRGFSNDQEVQNILEVTSFIQGALGKINTGLELESEIVYKAQGRIWKEYTFTIKGESKEEICLGVNYVTASNVTLAQYLTLAESLPREIPQKTIKFRFYPEKASQDELEILKESQIEGVPDWDELTFELQKIRTELLGF